LDSEIHVSKGCESSKSVAVGYIRCGLPDEWLDYYLSEECISRIPSRSTKNRWFYDQRNLIRRVVAARRLKLLRCFFDAEGTPLEPTASLPLVRREELAQLFISVRNKDASVVILDHRQRLDQNRTVQCLLCKALSELGVKVIEAKTGDDISAVRNWEARLAEATSAKLKKAERQVRTFKSLVTRLQRGSTSGRKPFGQTEEEKKAISRIKALYRILPRNKWKYRAGQVVKRRSFREIARCLNAEDFSTRTGVPWSDRMVSAILERLGLLGAKRKEPYEGS